MDPQTPVIVGAAQLSGRDGNNEPIEMMTTVASAALSQAPVPVSALRVVKGVWPYANPAALLADRLGIRATTGLTQLGGNESLDLFNQTAHDIASGHLDAAVLSSAETMRTRRTDRKAGRRSPYLAEADETFTASAGGTDRSYRSPAIATRSMSSWRTKSTSQSMKSAC